MADDHRTALPKLPPDRMRLVYAITVAVAALGLLLSWQAGLLSRQRGLAEQQAQVQGQLADFRAHLETRIYSSLALVRGLSADLVLREEIAPPDFARIADELRMSDPYLLTLALAPGFRVDAVYPSAGNEPLLGTDLMASPQFKSAMLDAVQLDNAVLAGPNATASGKQGLTCLVPVWVARKGVPRLWGATLLTLDFDALLQDSGMATMADSLRVEIRGRDAMGPAGELFYGGSERMDREAVRVPVFVPGGSWLLSAEPRGGWNVPAWWQTPAGLIGMALTALSAWAVFQILRDRLRIRTLAGVDPLTYLPNRRVALARLQVLLNRGRRQDKAFALLAIDLDGFKPVNDQYGHAAGDAVLAAVGQRLRQAVRGGDLIARMGGDEFLLLLDDPADTRDDRLLAYAQRIRDSLRQPVLVEGKPIRIGASIGVAAYPRHGGNAVELLREADEAMYRAKRERASGVALARRLDAPDADA